MHRHVRCARSILACLALLAALVMLAACGSSRHPAGSVEVLPAKGDINSVMAGYLDRGLSDAQRNRASAVVIELDTPGGLDSSMREIIQHMNSSTVPVIVYVYPSGARAASAGTFITEAAALAAMAPGTNIGAASPVTSSGGDIGGTEGTKVTNDAVAFIRSLAQAHGRNADWAESAVRTAAALPANEALAQHVVDVVAPDLTSLLQQADGRTVRVASTDVVLQTKNRTTYTENKSLAEQVLDVISDPNIAFLLLTIGGLALAFEVIHPTLVTGVFGGILLVLGLFALGSLPTNWAGVALILLAFGFFAADVYSGGHGILAAGGLVALIAGGLILVSATSANGSVSLWLILGIAAVVALLFVGSIRSLYRARRRPSAVGSQTMVGKEAQVVSRLDPEGYVLIGGENWRARLDSGAAEPGGRVLVVAVNGLELAVSRQPSALSPQPDSDKARQSSRESNNAERAGADPRARTNIDG